MSYTIQGKITEIKDEQIITPSFKKREFVITTNEQYPQDVLLEFTQDKCDELNKANIGQEVKVDFNLRGRKWVNPDGESKYFNTLQAWRIGSVGMVDTFTNDGDYEFPMWLKSNPVALKLIEVFGLSTS